MTKREIRMTKETARTNDEPAGRGAAPARRQADAGALPRPTFRQCLFVVHSSLARVLIIAVLITPALALIAGCSGFGHKQTRRDVYMNLMTPLERSKFLFLEATDKPVSIQMAYLQEIGVYQKWVEVPKNTQEAILRREVKEGMTPLQVHMAWGRPEEQRDETVAAERAEGHTKTVWEYGLRAQKVGGSGYERSVCFFDERVLWVRRSR